MFGVTQVQQVPCKSMPDVKMASYWFQSQAQRGTLPVSATETLALCLSCLTLIEQHG